MLISFFILLFYAIRYLILSNTLRKKAQNIEPQELVGISIIVPFRNEAASCSNFLNSIESLDFPQHLVEFIFCDDGSSDESQTQVSTFVNSQVKSHALLLRKENQTGKKALINEAVQLAKFDWIMLSDMDTTFDPKRLEHFALSAHPNLDLIIGKVELSRGSYIQNFQALEYDLMMNLAEASTKMHNPILGSSANLMFRKEKFLKVEPYKNNLQIASGDDVFLINRLKDPKKQNSLFLSVDQATVNTKSHKDLASFFKQRIRWAGKNASVKDYLYQEVSWLSLLCNLSLVILFCLAIFGFVDWLVVIGFLSIKTLIDLYFYYSSKSKQKFSLLFLLQFAVIYPIYLTFIGLLSFLIRPQWR